jgi:hypothetical protein
MPDIYHHTYEQHIYENTHTHIHAHRYEHSHTYLRPRLARSFYTQSRLALQRIVVGKGDLS